MYGPPIEPVPPPYGTPICRHPLEPLNQSDSRHPAIAGMASGLRSYGNLKNRHAWAPHSGFAPPYSGLRRPLVPISAHSRSHFRSYYGATTPIGPLSNARDSLNCGRSLPAHPTSRRILSQRRSVQPQENVELPWLVWLFRLWTRSGTVLGFFYDFITQSGPTGKALLPKSSGPGVSHCARHSPLCSFSHAPLPLFEAT